jgi:uncharacterized protein (TIGR02594 family)
MIHTPRGEPPWLQHARQHLGLREIPGPKHHPLILAMWRAIKRGGIKDDETAWCAAFVGWCLETQGIRSSRFESARSYLDWGVPLQGPVVGAVCVLGRPGHAGAGHVFIVTGMTPAGNIVGIGGNQGNAVSEDSFDPERVLGYRYPAGLPVPVEPVPLRMARVSVNEA